jgi:hypothetical protein
MAKQTFTTGQVLTAAQMTSLQETAMGGGPATAKTASYVLVAADAGTTVAMNAAGATTITVNTGLFAAGDTVFIQNLGAGACTVTAGTATVATAGSLILPQNDAGILYFTATGAAIFYDYIQAGAVSPLTTKGDLYTFSTSDARLGVGANGTTLVADSAEATGLKWATPASGGGMTLISETVASALTTLSLSSIPQTYKQLLLVWNGIGVSASTTQFSIRLNNNSSAVYAEAVGFMTNTNPDVEIGAKTSMANGYSFASGASSANLQEKANGMLLIDNYASSTKLKFYHIETSYYDAGNTNRTFVEGSGTFNSTTAITSIDVVRLSAGGTFSNSTNTTIRLYGLS